MKSVGYVVWSVYNKLKIPKANFPQGTGEWGRTKQKKMFHFTSTFKIVLKIKN